MNADSFALRGARRRDAGLRRLRFANRIIAGAAIALTGALAELAAGAFPGHAKRVATSSRLQRDPGAARSPRAGTAPPSRGRPAHRATHTIRPPAKPPTASSTQPSSSAPAPAPAQAPAAAPAPAPAPTPAPVVSGGS